MNFQLALFFIFASAIVVIAQLPFSQQAASPILTKLKAETANNNSTNDILPTPVPISPVPVVSQDLSNLTVKEANELEEQANNQSVMEEAETVEIIIPSVEDDPLPSASTSEPTNTGARESIGLPRFCVNSVVSKFDALPFKAQKLEFRTPSAFDQYLPVADSTYRHFQGITKCGSAYYLSKTGDTEPEVFTSTTFNNLFLNARIVLPKERRYQTHAGGIDCDDNIVVVPVEDDRDGNSQNTLTYFLRNGQRVGVLPRSHKITAASILKIAVDRYMIALLSGNRVYLLTCDANFTQFTQVSSFTLQVNTLQSLKLIQECGGALYIALFNKAGGLEIGRDIMDLYMVLGSRLGAVKVKSYHFDNGTGDGNFQKAANVYVESDGKLVILACPGSRTSSRTIPCSRWA